ncbi:MAG: glycoside hydrolase family 16 protein, partial [Maritimibacter sp.]|nr:glycoside hydrolase family 16 protein [Maritimibacter sp.]
PAGAAGDDRATAAARHGAALSAPDGQSGAWALVFQDEFNGPELDPARWVTCHWWAEDGCTIATNNELEWYRPENVALRDGALVLTARAGEYRTRSGAVFPYTSGMVSTGQDGYASPVPHRFADTHFYAEIRARIPAGRGLWPALWLLPAANTHPPEIDIMEVLGQEPRTLYMTTHYLDAGGEMRNVQHSYTSRAPLDDWHVFAVDWQPDRITWYLDGKRRAEVTAPAMAIPQEPMYLVANLAVGGDWPGSPNRSTVFPAEFAIDFVRIWKRAR